MSIDDYLAMMIWVRILLKFGVQFAFRCFVIRLGVLFCCLILVHDQIRSNALIKRGSLKMQRGQQEDALADFNLAVEQDPENSDIYHHRGQVGLSPTIFVVSFQISYRFHPAVAYKLVMVPLEIFVHSSISWRKE